MVINRQSTLQWAKNVNIFVTGVAFTVAVLAGSAILSEEAQDGEVVYRVIRDSPPGKNLLSAEAWAPYGKGFSQENGVITCDAGNEARSQWGAAQSLTLNQTEPRPIVAEAESAAHDVGGTRDNDYSLYIDIEYMDGTPLWGQAAPFDVGTHDWQKRRVVVFPEKPIKRLSCYMLFRNHSGKVSFRNPQLYELAVEKAALFDGVPCLGTEAVGEGFLLRDVEANSDFVALKKSALGIECDCHRTEADSATFFDVTVRSRSPQDRSVTLLYVVPVKRLAASSQPTMWLRNFRTAEAVSASREYDAFPVRTRTGATGFFSRFPLAAVTTADRGRAIGLDMLRPAVFRVGYNAAFEQLFIAFDLGLTPEKPEATIRFVVLDFPAQHGLRAAWAKYMSLFPEQFTVRIAKQGLWMPFARISQVSGWEDFGFRFKEGNNETAWDDAHDILTFRYTEPMTWWMPMAKDLPRSYEAAVQEAERLLSQGQAQAKAWRTSSFRDENGKIPVRLLDTPWCNGAVWSMNSLPQIPGEVTDFSLKWNQTIKEQLYGVKRRGDLDGEYIDSSEGYVTEELDFRRDHFVGERPLTFDNITHKPAVFRGLIAFEYVQAIAEDVHGTGKYMMANGTPGNLCWLVPLLDVMGTETNWNWNGKWSPMSDDDLLYRRALCGKKPYCFLMNTDFDRFDRGLVEKYMKRSLAYGMFPGFFSPDASSGHYFSRPELYNRDRDLFKKYVPLCRIVSEAGWEPITLARSDREKVRVERFGSRYITVLNDSEDAVTAHITLDSQLRVTGDVKELVQGRTLSVRDSSMELALDAGDVAVLDLGGSPQ